MEIVKSKSSDSRYYIDIKISRACLAGKTNILVAGFIKQIDPTNVAMANERPRFPKQEGRRLSVAYCTKKLGEKLGRFHLSPAQPRL